MELHKFHIDELSAGVICKRMTIPGIFPTVTSDLKSATYSTCCKYHCLCPKYNEPATFTIITKCACNALLILQQTNHRAFHMHFHSLVNAMILQRANHF